MRIDILTLFPGMFTGPFSESIVRRAVEEGRVQIFLHNIRDWATDRHRTVDDTPYGGGAGMVLKPEVLGRAIRAVRALAEPAPVILLTPQGRPFHQRLAAELAGRPRLILLCGHYEGVDERVRLLHVDEEVSIGDYVLTGGELPAMVLVDAVVRLLPGVLDQESLAAESHHQGLLEYPHYTRPATYGGLTVPPILLSGHHAEIACWRRREALRRTFLRRPDLLAVAPLTAEDRAFLRTLGWTEPADSRPRLLLASANPGKVQEYRDLLGDLPLELVTPAELGLEGEVEESGDTYQENACRKALTLARRSGLITLADDSGLEVDALGGAPGPRSHRYQAGSDAERDRHLLQQLEGLPPERRTARFRCVIAIATPEGEVYTVEGVCPGRIAAEPRGTGGFGYDPIFLLPELGRTMAELSREEKNRLSHRARAARRARPILRQLFALG